MNDHALYVRHYRSLENLHLAWHAGRITRLEAAAVREPPGWWVAPGLFDLQVNGFAGVDFQAEGLPPERLLHAVRALRSAGCTRFLLTLVTDDWERMMLKIKHLRALREASSELTAALAGWHVEGPFLSAEPGYCGAHEVPSMLDPTPERIAELREVTGSDPVLLTLAPERPGALQAIRQAIEAGIRVSLGHTNASQATLAQAVDAGATAFTHLGNGCPADLDRHDNILWRVFETTGLAVSLIPDGIHVSPPLFRLMHRLLPLESLLYVSDAMAAAGSPPGRYSIGNLQVEVGPDQTVRHPDHPGYAGSALKPIEGVFRAASMLGTGWQEAWRRFSQRPADLMGLPSRLAVGERADFCLLRVSPRGKLIGHRVVSGE